jgi:Mrp family chromosome partitioning ATPase
LISKGVNKDGEVIEETKRTIYRPKQEAMQTIARNVGKNGVLKVLEDESKYDKYYDATKNIILDIDRKTNPDATDERFPTKEVFKSEAMPRLIEEIKGNLERV